MIRSLTKREILDILIWEDENKVHEFCHELRQKKNSKVLGIFDEDGRFITWKIEEKI